MYELLKPLLFRLPAEAAHRLPFGTPRAGPALPCVKGLLGAALPARASALEVRPMGLRFPNPIVLAAGFDKHAAGYAALSSLGFGAIEVGTITGQPQLGNPRPRLFRFPADRALLNRM